MVLNKMIATMTKCSRSLFKELENETKFNPKKLVVCRSEILFFSYTVPRDDLKADSKKVEMQLHEKDEKQLFSFLRLVNYLKVFTPSL